MTFAGIFICSNCEAEFGTITALREHKRSAHNPLASTLAKHRPIDRGPVACGHPGCAQTFKNDINAAQHRRMKHPGWQP